MIKIICIIEESICRYCDHFQVIYRLFTYLLSNHQLFILASLQYFVLLQSINILVELCLRIPKLFHCHFLQNYSSQDQFPFNKFNPVDLMDHHPNLAQN